MSVRATVWGLVLAGGLAGLAQAAPHPTIVLVHGAFESADIWKSVEARLHRRHYKTIAVNLPGRRGLAPSDPALGLAPYKDAVLAAISHERRPVILVGHSFGGMTITAVAQAAPQKVRTLVYVAAYLPANGQSLQTLSQQDKGSKVGPAFRVSDDKSYAFIDPAQRVELFCNGCDAASKAAVDSGFVNEPLAPLAAPATVSADRFGKVDKVYIHTAKDQVVSPDLQTAMVAATPVRKEITLDTGHAPFVAAPDALARAIEAAVR